jgi:hypothetical protein
MLYMAIGVVNISHYMGRETTEEKQHLVEANSTDEAEEKFIKYYESQTSEYDVYFKVYDVDICETII